MSPLNMVSRRYWLLIIFLGVFLLIALLFRQSLRGETTKVKIGPAFRWPNSKFKHQQEKGAKIVPKHVKTFAVTPFATTFVPTRMATTTFIRKPTTTQHRKTTTQQQSTTTQQQSTTTQQQKTTTTTTKKPPTTTLKPKTTTTEAPKSATKSPKELREERIAMANKRKLWEPIATAKDKALFMDLMKTFAAVMAQNKAFYSITGGTLFGSYRHHGFVPWDDDFDVIANVSDRPKIEKMFAHLKPNYTMGRAGQRHKFYHKDSLPITGYSWRWPYIDITFIRDNGTFLQETASAYGVAVKYPRSIILPTHKRPFEDMWLESPRDAFATLVWSYGTSKACRMIGYSHMLEKGDKWGNVPCKQVSQMYPKYPFVRHTAHPSTKRMKEEKMVEGKVVKTVFIDEPLYAECDTYGLFLKNKASLPTDRPWPDKNTKLI